ncbi:hypothetical protein DHW03_05285 [Pedobacter yonginense]|uniref:Uncharacterized protein n=1 Tax=Pedobacter yonginense TaxID=651869 RepID=A0A317ERB7_9SPHI|nr:hypothetical protein [Pedobacter yonginense]PWS29234.1 hypothetical protein DHW03_05285 [Pedobacter yonginense]
MKTEKDSQLDKDEKKNTKTSGTSKEKASFDQNGEGASEKFGKAGSTPNEGGDENGVGTAKKDKK